MQGIQESLHLTLHPLLVKQNPEDAGCPFITCALKKKIEFCGD